MDTRTRIIALVAVLIVIASAFVLLMPSVTPLVYEEHTELESYPTYYYSTFDINEDLNSPTLEVNVGITADNSSFIIYYHLFQTNESHFLNLFNVTESFELMQGNPQNAFPDEVIWSGSGTYLAQFPKTSYIEPGAYVFVFWIDPAESPSQWSATVSISVTVNPLAPAT